MKFWLISQNKFVKYSCSEHGSLFYRNIKMLPLISLVCTYLHDSSCPRVDDSDFLVLTRGDDPAAIPVPRARQGDVGKAVDLH